MARRTIPARTRIFLILVLLAGAYFGLSKTGVLPSLRFKPSVTPEAQTPMPTTVVRGQQSATKPVELALPSATPISRGRTFKMEIIPWNSQLGFLFANGGPVTTKGSLMEKWGVKNLEIVRQDDCYTMRASAIHSAQIVASGGEPDIAGWTIMGDFTATWVKPLNAELQKFGTRVVLVASTGRSFGEDQYLGLPEVFSDPQKACGSVIVGVVGDGDVNICLNFADANKIPVNRELGTYDENAMNFFNTKDFVTAYKMWIAGRKVTLTNKKTGKPQEYDITGLATWTPGDEQAVNGRPGLVTIANTRSYPNQMPNGFFVLESWAQKHPNEVIGMICAMSEGADMINAYPQALRRAGDISAQVYGERDGQYWASLYESYEVTDRLGNRVRVGGSMVHNIADMTALFGLNGGVNAYELYSYQRHGEFIVALWPDMLDAVPPFSSVFDDRYLRQATQKLQSRAPIFRQDFASAPSGGSVMSQADWAVNFYTGSAQLTDQAQAVLGQVLSQLGTMSGVRVEIHGHTDDVGDADMNMNLSRARANAVKHWLENRDPTNFGPGRVEIYAHGEEQPKVNDLTDWARSQNRRVEIITRRIS